MPHELKISAHVGRYKSFLQLYPSSYKERFAEPMLQTFTDMLNERAKVGEVSRGFVLNIYADTLKEIIKEHSKEVVMNVKTKKSKAVISGGVAGLLIVAVVGVIIFNGKGSGSIPLYSTVEQAKAYSKGKKDSCLPNNESAAEAIKKDDTIESYEYEGQEMTFSNFETNAVAGFSDIPAGTNGEVTKNSYDGTLATGSIVYEQNYGSYNYSMKRLPDTKQWELVTLTACEK